MCHGGVTSSSLEAYVSSGRKAVWQRKLGGLTHKDIEALYSIALDTRYLETISSQLGELSCQFQHGRGGVCPMFKSSS